MSRPVIILTRMWPTPDQPSVGTYVRERTAGVPNIRVVRPRWAAAPNPIVYAQLFIDALRAGPIRGVEAHMLFPTGLVGLIVATLRGVPLIVYSHGRDVRERRRLAAVRWLVREVARRADRLVANSEDTATRLRAIGGRPDVLFPGVDLTRFAPSPRPATRRVLYLGGRIEYKGYDVARTLADTLVGPALRDLNPREIPALIAAHDVVLMPSSVEAFGLVAVEAIASGRWVVASSVGGLRDIIIDGVNGTLVTDGDFAGALAGVPDYDPKTIAATVERFSLQRWQEGLAHLWDEVAPRDA
jgi:glycosyltransferase involved in cell wall biosynthesis